MSEGGSESVGEQGPFAGQVALVTGSSKGIGAATAEALAAAGAHVILTGRDVKALEAVEERIFEAGGSATIAPVDLTEADSIARLASAIRGRWDALDILVLNAAVLPDLMAVSQIESSGFNRTLTTNVLAQQALLASFDPMLKQSKDARVIGITSSVAAAPRAFWGAYAASKAAFEVLLDCYGKEVKNISNIRVAIVNPGATRTAMRAKAYPGEDPSAVKLPAVVADYLVDLLGKQFATGTRESINPAS